MIINKLKNNRSVFLEIIPSLVASELELPFFSGGISAGFPSPALDFADLSIDLNKHLVKHPSATFYGRVKGFSMQDEGISDGDLLVIDKSLEAHNGKIVVCFIDGEFTVKKIKLEKDHCWLMPANKDYKPILVTDENDFLIWGIVTYVIKSF
jgi:DNA polymerase V